MRILISGLVALLITGCGTGPQRINDNYERTVTTEERERLLSDLFDCDECGNGQLRRVQELGNTAVPRLIEVKDGMVPDRTAEFAARCSRINDRLIARGLVPAESCAQYSARFQDKLRRRYRARAIDGLFAIRTQSACDAIGGDVCNEKPPFPGLSDYFSTTRSIRHMGVDLPIEP